MMKIDKNETTFYAATLLLFFKINFANVVFRVFCIVLASDRCMECTWPNPFEPRICNRIFPIEYIDDKRSVRLWSEKVGIICLHCFASSCVKCEFVSNLFSCVWSIRSHKKSSFFIYDFIYNIQTERKGEWDCNCLNILYVVCCVNYSVVFLHKYENVWLWTLDPFETIRCGTVSRGQIFAFTCRAILPRFGC